MMQNRPRSQRLVRRPRSLARVAPRAALHGFPVGWGAQPVERGSQDRLAIRRVAGDRGDGHEEVQNLLEREVTADLVRLLRGGEERPAGGKHPGAAVLEHGIASVRVPEHLGGDAVLGCDEGDEPARQTASTSSA